MFDLHMVSTAISDGKIPTNIFTSYLYMLLYWEWKDIIFILETVSSGHWISCHEL